MWSTSVGKMHHARGLSFSLILTDSFAYESLGCLETGDFRAENDDNMIDPIIRHCANAQRHLHASLASQTFAKVWPARHARSTNSSRTAMFSLHALYIYI